MIKKKIEVEVNDMQYRFLTNQAEHQKQDVSMLVAKILATWMNFIHLDRKKDYMREYYRKNPHRFRKGKKRRPAKNRAQDRIDASFRNEDRRFNSVQFSYCQNAACPKPNKKYVKGTGVSLSFRGVLLDFCSGRCREIFIAQNQYERC